MVPCHQTEVGTHGDQDWVREALTKFPNVANKALPREMFVSKCWWGHGGGIPLLNVVGFHATCSDNKADDMKAVGGWYLDAKRANDTKSTLTEYSFN